MSKNILSVNDRFIAENIYISHGLKMRNIAYSILKNKEDAEDAFQNAMCKIVKNIHIFYNKSDNETAKIINEIQKNEAVNILRKRKNHSGESIDQSIYEFEDINAKQIITDNLLLNEIYDHLKEQDQLSRQIIVLYYITNLTEKEIARLTGVSRNTVIKKLKQSKNKLSDRLSDGGDKNDKKD